MLKLRLQKLTSSMIPRCNHQASVDSDGCDFACKEAAETIYEQSTLVVKCELVTRNLKTWAKNKHRKNWYCFLHLLLFKS